MTNRLKSIFGLIFFIMLGAFLSLLLLQYYEAFSRKLIGAIVFTVILGILLSIVGLSDSRTKAENGDIFHYFFRESILLIILTFILSLGCWLLIYDVESLKIGIIFIYRIIYSIFFLLVLYGFVITIIRNVLIYLDYRKTGKINFLKYYEFGKMYKFKNKS